MIKNRKKFLMTAALLVFSLIIMSSCSLFDFGTNNKDTNQKYDVSDNYFTYISFAPNHLTEANLVTGQTTTEYVIDIKSSCSVSLTEYSASVKLYSSDGTLLQEERVSKTQKINADKEFSFYVTVSQAVQQATKKVLVTYSGKSNDNPSKIKTKYRVTFVYNNGSADEVVSVQEGETLREPISPYKINCNFTGWYTNEELTQKYDFSKAVSDNLTLYAKYAVDYAALTNKITATTMKANVTVITKSYNTFLGITTSYSTKSGSGIIYTLRNGNYYLLTNNHVTIKDSAYDKVEYTIEDYRGNTYKGTLVGQNASYDLAALYFQKTETLQIVEMATTNPVIGTELVSLGQPKNQNNALTYGALKKYSSVTLDNTSTSASNVKFQVITHDCPTDRGSSGGALLNTDLKLVGINYAAGTSVSGTFIQGYAVPIEKVREFLRLYAGYYG